MGFNLDRRMYEQLRCMPTVPGAIGAFRRAALTTSAASPPTPWPRTPTSRWRSGGPAGTSSTSRRASAWTEAPATTAATVETAVPLVVRHHAGDVEAPRRRRGPRHGRRSAGGALPYMLLFQVLLPAARPDHRRVRRLRTAVPRHGRRFSPPGSASPPSNSSVGWLRLPARRRTGRPLSPCPCSKSSTANCCTSSSSSPPSPRCSAPRCAGTNSPAPATSRRP